MALAEGAAAGILPAEAYGSSFQRERAESKRLAEGPIDSAALGDDVAALLDEAAQLGMQVKRFREMRRTADHAIEHMLVHGSARAGCGVILAGHQAEVLQLEALGLLLYRVEGLLETAGDGALNGIELFRSQRTLANQALAVLLGGGRMVLDLAIENGLRIARIVAFVVAVAAIAIHVDHHVFAELLAVIEGYLHHADGGLRAIAVDVEDGRLNTARHVGGVRRGARFIRQGGESDLVVDDQMDGAAGGITIELRQIQR